MKKHFIDNHKTQFKEYFGEEVDWDETVKKSKKFDKMNANNPFGAGMPFMNMNNMFQMGDMFGANQNETEDMMKEFEKMMFGGGGMKMNMGEMEELFGGGGGGKKKKKKNKKK